MKKRNIILLIIAIVLFVLVGSSLAYFGWSSTNENKDQLVDVTISGGTGSCTKIEDNQKLLYPTSSRENGRIIKVKAKQQMAPNAFISWNLKVNSINEDSLTTDGLKHQSFKYELVNSNTGVSYGTGNFENIEEGTTITLSTTEETLDYNTEYTFTLYLWIDGTIGNNPLDMNSQPYDFDLTCGITGTDTKKSNATPISDFEYYLGSDYSVVDTIDYEYYDEVEDDYYYYDISVAPMELETNEVLLTKYIGSSTNVTIPNTYEVNGVTYNVVVLSYVYLNDNMDIDDDDGIFFNNNKIETVILGSNIKLIYNDGYDEVINNSMYKMFNGCTSLVNAPEIPSSVTDMSYTFSGCSSLVSAPDILSSVTNMSYTFSGCSSLVNAPDIPNSVTNMSHTFQNCTSLKYALQIEGSVTDMSYTYAGCTSLIYAPDVHCPVTNMQGTFQGCISLVNVLEIPISVTNMDYTFFGCSSLVNAPEIPSLVTNMSYTFRNCTNLEGTVKINSSNVTSVSNIFNGTTKNITVQVPSDSTTYTKLNALTNSNGMPSNVTLTTFIS